MTDTVLLVEDELFIALDLQATIEGEGFHVDGPYTTLVEAQEAIARHQAKFAAAVLDVRLADATVFPAADQLDAAGVPIIFHSGHVDEGEMRRRYPAATVCPKPSPPVELAAALRRSARRDGGRMRAAG